MSDPAAASEDDLSRAQRIAKPFARFMKKWRAIIERRPWLNVLYKVIVTVLGVLVTVIGVILIPLPGPGWLIVFLGMTILGSEYHWARRLTGWLRMQLARFWERWRAWRAARAERAERAAQSE
ncbi:MAG: TIGR02611 family protein [Actinobacteria bacterium]|jgi:uncharacterized protein (TIGR02611 family)|nr:TIGR02611 family protein [Actinomycetota bacterium]